MDLQKMSPIRHRVNDESSQETIWIGGPLRAGSATGELWGRRPCPARFPGVMKEPWRKEVRRPRKSMEAADVKERRKVLVRSR